MGCTVSALIFVFAIATTPLIYLSRTVMRRYFGLTPSQDQSGDRNRRAQIL